MAVNQTKKAISELRAASRSVQASGGAGAVPTSRKIADNVKLLADTISKLEADNKALQEQLKAAHATDSALKAEVADLREELEALEARQGWPTPPVTGAQPLPPDYWETAQ